MQTQRPTIVSRADNSSTIEQVSTQHNPIRWYLELSSGNFAMIKSTIWNRSLIAEAQGANQRVISLGPYIEKISGMNRFDIVIDIHVMASLSNFDHSNYLRSRRLFDNRKGSSCGKKPLRHLEFEKNRQLRCVNVVLVFAPVGLKWSRFRRRRGPIIRLIRSQDNIIWYKPITLYRELDWEGW